MTMIEVKIINGQEERSRKLRYLIDQLHMEEHDEEVDNESLDTQSNTMRELAVVNSGPRLLYFTDLYVVYIRILTSCGT